MMSGATLSVNAVDPREVGMNAERLQRLRRAVEEDTAAGLYDGAVFVVGRHGRIVMHAAVGTTYRETQRPARPDDVFFVMSITKQLTTIRVLMAVEQGAFGLDTPACAVIPGFGSRGKGNVTVRHVLSHTSGLNTELPWGLPADRLADIETVTAFLGAVRLLTRPGRAVSYNPVTACSVVAAMVTRLDGARRPFRRILQEDVFDPLGMRDTAPGVPARLRERLVAVVARDRTPGLFDPHLVEATNGLLGDTGELPAGGAVSTALDIFRCAGMLRRGGELDGVRILSPGVVREATTNQTGELGNSLWDYAREASGWPDFPAYLGLSFFLRGRGDFPTPLGRAASPGSFGGIGAGSTLFWVDPERALTFVFLSAGLMEDARSVERHERLSDLVLDAAD